MELQCWRCKTCGNFNDGIGEDVLFHVHGWILWGEEDDKHYASCPNCWLQDNYLFEPGRKSNKSNQSTNGQALDSTIKIPHTHPMDIFFSVEANLI